MITRRGLLAAGLGSVAAEAVSGQLMGGSTTRVEAGLSTTGVKRSMVPRSNPPARRMMAASVAHFGSDEQTAFAVMQGVLNRSQPRVFLVHDVEDGYWLNWLRERGDIETIDWVGAHEILRRFRNRLKGCIVTDPSVAATRNVATFLAGLKDAVVVSPELIEPFGLPVLEDLRGRWKRDIEAYRWAYDQFFAAANPSALAHLNPCSSRLRDYMAEFGVFIFWLSGSKEADGEDEIEFARELFTRVGPNIPVLGWWGAHGQGSSPGIREQKGVDLASEYGLRTVCMAWDGYCEGTSNLSVHSGTAAMFRQKPAPSPPPLENKIYFAFLRTDGDGTNFWRQEFLKRWWDPERGRIPMNWPVGPSVSEFMPDILDYFYTHASPDDYFMAAVSGMGYIHEDVYGARLTEERRKAGFAEFLRLTGDYMKRMDLHHIHTYKTSSVELARQYARVEGVQGLFLDYNRNDATDAGNAATMIDGVPAFRTVMKGSEFRGKPWDEQVQNAVAQIRKYTPPQRPAFLSVTLSNWGYKEEKDMETLAAIEKIRRQLGPEYAAVRADHLVQLYRTHVTRNRK
jgi:hypothetical protein